MLNKIVRFCYNCGFSTWLVIGDSEDIRALSYAGDLDKLAEALKEAADRHPPLNAVFEKLAQNYIGQGHSPTSSRDMVPEPQQTKSPGSC